MPLRSDYADGNCSVARTLEIVGERWTLLIVRDAFYGVRHFGDFAAQLGIPRAVLATRLKTLVAEGIFTRDDEADSGVEYRLTDKGLALWPVLRSLMSWGDEFYSPDGPRRVMRHEVDGGLLDANGRCATCRRIITIRATRLERGPGFDKKKVADDAVSTAIDKPRRLLDPIRNVSA